MRILILIYENLVSFQLFGVLLIYSFNMCLMEFAFSGRFLFLSFCNSLCVHGSCDYHFGGPKCTCFHGYRGSFCETAIHKLTTTKSAAIVKQTVIPSTIQPTTVPQTSTTSPTFAYTASSCEDSPMVKCQDVNVCSSNLKPLCPVSCRLCTPTTTTTAQPCVNNPLVKCSSPSICTSTLESLCPVTCGKCAHLSTKAPCANNPMVKCSSSSVCVTPLAAMCPVTCGNCGHISTLSPTQITTTSWFNVPGIGGK